MLNLEKFEINKKDKLIVGVSGGPDSMFLLFSLINEGYNPIVCHVNYHKRDTASRDEDIVREYCENNNLTFYKKDCTSYIGNFQEYAREFRYNFFYEIYSKEDAKYLLVAHQLDDALETYLFRKNRNSKGASLAIQEKEFIFNMNVIRPLLDLSKSEILDLCNKNNILYGIDESNLSNDYSRNKIRNEYLSSLTVKEKDSLIKEMKEAESNWQSKRKEVLKIITDNSFKLSSFESLDKEGKDIVLCELIRTNCLEKSKKISEGYLNEIISIVSKTRSHCFIELEKDVYLEKDNDLISLVKQNTDDFCYVIKNKEDKSCLYLKESGKKMEGVFVKDSDYPLTIRNAKENDQIELKEGHKSVSRLFIDKKIPLLERKIYPILLNKDGEILLIPMLYRKQDRKDLNNNLFMLK